MYPFKIYVSVTNLTCAHMEACYLCCLCWGFVPRFPCHSCNLCSVRGADPATLNTQTCIDA